LGAGGWGREYVRSALRDDRWDVVGFVDINAEVHKTLAEEHGVPKDKIFSDASDALDVLNPDAVTCSIPNTQRIPIVLQALERGIHLLIDKPVVHTVNDLKELLRVHSKSQTVFSLA